MEFPFDIAAVASHPLPYFAAFAWLVWHRLSKGEQKMDKMDAKLGALEGRMDGHEDACHVRHTANVEARALFRGEIKVIQQDVTDVKRRVTNLENRPRG